VKIVDHLLARRPTRAGGLAASVRDNRRDGAHTGALEGGISGRSAVTRLLHLPHRATRWLPVLLTVALLGAAQTCEPPVRVYGLTADSRYLVGCFPPLACLLGIAEDVGGTFRLVRRPRREGDPFEHFAVRDVFWLVRFGGRDIPVTGSGTYQLGGEFAIQQRLELDLRVGEEEVQHFDSGFVTPEPPGFPHIDVRVSIHGETGFDQVFDVRAIPFPLRAVPRTPCSPELSCDPVNEICVARTPVGPTVIYACEPVPAGCEDDRSCGCAGTALCTEPFDACTQTAENTLECACPECQ
jgi:hypothetical protein